PGRCPGLWIGLLLRSDGAGVRDMIRIIRIMSGLRAPFGRDATVRERSGDGAGAGPLPYGRGSSRAGARDPIMIRISRWVPERAWLVLEHNQPGSARNGSYGSCLSRARHWKRPRPALVAVATHRWPCVARASCPFRPSSETGWK